MRYSIDFDRLVNKLVPHYLGGRKFILLLQSMVYPLRSLSEKFLEFANEKKIEACVTSQKIYLEWYLNRQMKKYFEREDEDAITILESGGNRGDVVLPIFYESEVERETSRHLRVFNEKEGECFWIVSLLQNLKIATRYGFVVKVPPCEKFLIDENVYLNRIRSIVDRYKIAGKTYIIQY